MDEPVCDIAEDHLQKANCPVSSHGRLLLGLMVHCKILCAMPGLALFLRSSNTGRAGYRVAAGASRRRETKELKMFRAMRKSCH